MLMAARWMKRGWPENIMASRELAQWEEHTDPLGHEERRSLAVRQGRPEVQRA